MSRHRAALPFLRLRAARQGAPFAVAWQSSPPCRHLHSRRENLSGLPTQVLALDGKLKKVLGEAPEYDFKQQQPFDYLQHLLQWGAPAGADLPCCIVPGSGAHAGRMCFDAAAAHAAGCFPHAWRAPLKASQVQQANRKEAKEAAADAQAVLERALQQGRAGSSGSSQPPSRQTSSRQPSGQQQSGRQQSDPEQFSPQQQQPQPAPAGGKPSAATAKQGGKAAATPGKQGGKAAAAAGKQGGKAAAPVPGKAAAAGGKQAGKAVAAAGKKAGKPAAAAAAEPDPAPQPVSPGGALKAWAQSEGWFRRSITATATRQKKLGLEGNSETPRRSMLCASKFKVQNNISFQACRPPAAACLAATPPAGKLFERLTGQAGASQSTLEVFDPQLRQRYSIAWRVDVAARGANLHVSAHGLPCRLQGCLLCWGPGALNRPCCGGARPAR